MVQQFLDVVIPQGCALCGTRVTGIGVCEACRRELPWLLAACPRCARPVPTGLTSKEACGACQRRPPPFDRAVAPLHYGFPIDSLIKSLKFRNQLWLAPVLAELVAPAVTERHLRVDGIVPVPLHRWRHARRGFNQADELARALGRQLDLPRLALLRRHRRTRPQTGLSAAARRRNLSRAFAFVGSQPPKRVLLIDDVITTGETARSAAEVLRSAGVAEICLVAVARAS